MVESSTVYGRVAGSIPVGPAFTPVAQWTERKFAELEVAGSIPARGAICRYYKNMERGTAWCGRRPVTPEFQRGSNPRRSAR